MATAKACTAALRAGASRRDRRMEVLYSGRQVRLALGWLGEELLSGVWQVDVSGDGRRAEPTSPWEETIRVSDDRVDYLELASEFVGGLCIERQVLLAREDRFLFLADVVVAPGPGRLEYRARLPFSPDTHFRGAKESRAGFLAGRRRWGVVLPLALPEWRAEGCCGSLGQTEHGVELCQSTQGRALYAPLFVDLDPRRFRRARTWRRLTVAENLVAQPADVAAGYRVQIGSQQWLIYRSLATKANRSLLGHNLSSEMLVARFRRSGEVDPLVEIE